MICHIRIKCAYEVGTFRSRAQIIFLDGPYKGKMTDCQILCAVENGDLLRGEYTGSIGLDMTRGEFRPMKRT